MLKHPATRWKGVALIDNIKPKSPSGLTPSSHEVYPEGIDKYLQGFFIFK
jgi:hypothetical protein